MPKWTGTTGSNHAHANPYDKTKSISFKTPFSSLKRKSHIAISSNVNLVDPDEEYQNVFHSLRNQDRADPNFNAKLTDKSSNEHYTYQSPDDQHSISPDQISDGQKKSVKWLLMQKDALKEHE